MGMLEELNDLLDRVPLWKRLASAPDRLQALEQRVAALEAQLSGKPGALCPACNAPGFNRTGSREHPVFGVMGIKLDSYACPACGHSEERERSESAQL